MHKNYSENGEKNYPLSIRMSMHDFYLFENMADSRLDEANVRSFIFLTDQYCLKEMG